MLHLRFAALGSHALAQRAALTPATCDSGWQREDKGHVLGLAAPKSTVAATMRLGYTSESKHATYLHATLAASAQASLSSYALSWPPRPGEVDAS